MKAIIALLFGLASLSYSDKVLEFDSDSADTSDSTSYNGIIVAVYQDDDASPVVALGSDIDNYDDVYCLNFIGLFEASSYDTSVSENGEFTEIADTNVDLADANCTTSQQSDTQFTISCNDVDHATLTLTFTFTQDSEGDYGVEYTISLSGYTLNESDAKLVLVQSVQECSDLYDVDSDEDDDESTTEAPETTDEPTTTEQEEMESTEADDMDTTEIRRRMQATGTTDFDDDDMGSTEIANESTEAETTDAETTEDEDDDDDESDSTDSESLEEEDGISEDDSDEFDAGFARFVVDGQALDVCESEGGETTSTEIESTLVFQKDDGELHIVFDSFECDLVLDPFYGLDESKYESVYGATPSPIDEDKAGSIITGIALIIGFIAVVFN